MKRLLFFSQLLVISCLLGLTSCNKEDGEEFTYPISDEQLAEAVQTSISISASSGEIITNSINSAFDNNEFLDVNQIAKKIEMIDGVLLATPTESGVGIVVKQKNGIYTNLIVVTKDNDKLFKQIESNFSPSFNEINEYLMHSVKPNNTRSENKDYILPTGTGKALILAPFQDSFKANLSKLERLLEQAGYEVTIQKDNKVTVDCFKGSYLSEYDIVFVDTHGAAHFLTIGGISTTIFCTGENFSSEKLKTYSEEERKSLASVSAGGQSYFGVSSQWIKKTDKSKVFPNSWFFANSCESYKIISGNSSMAATLTEMGVVGYNGFKESINVGLSNSIAEKMMSEFTSGLNFAESSNNVLSDWGLNTYSWWLRITMPGSSSVNLNLFKSNSTSKPFFIIDPDDVIGVAEVIPNYGPVGTGVTFRVTVKDKFIAKIERINFDIDNTGEHLFVNKINDNMWEHSNLHAPIAQVYPRVDTFTFTAYDSEGNQVGQSGSATFTITQGTRNPQITLSTRYYEDKNNR